MKTHILLDVMINAHDWFVYLTDLKVQISFGNSFPEGLRSPYFIQIIIILFIKSFAYLLRLWLAFFSYILNLTEHTTAS